MSSQPKFAYPAPEEQLPTGPRAEICHALRTRFDVIKKLSDCDTHSVFLAHDLTHAGGNTTAAGLVRLTILSPLLSEDHRQVQLFRLEAAAAARLDHGNIVKSAEAEETDGMHFSATQADSETKTLREYLKLKGWLSASEAAEIVLQIADGLAYAHRQGVLHLTLDPEKVLLSQDGRALVSGFGIGRDKPLMWARQERSRRCAAPYISPEQILSADVDQRSDLYLLGLLFYEMLTDRRPFETEDAAALRSKHLTRPPQPPFMFRPELSRAMSQIVLSLLGQRPDERPFSVDDFKATLRQCIEAGSIADEECSEIEWPAAAGDSLSMGGMISDVSDVGSEEAGVLTCGLASATTSLLDAPQSRTETDLPTLTSLESQDLADLPRAGYDNDFESLPEPSVDAISSLPPNLDALESPVQEPPAYPINSDRAEGPRLSSVGFSKVVASRLTWLVAVLLIGGLGIFWAMRIASFTGVSAGPVTSSEVAESRSNAEAVSSKTEAAAPAPERVDAEPVKENATRPGSLPPTGQGEPRGNTQEIATTEPDQAGQMTSATPLPLKSSAIVPPDLSRAGMVPLPESGLAAGLKNDEQNDLQAQEPPPPLGPPAGAEAVPPMIIRKSGDLLQNTATMRPKPIYPKGRRPDNVKGSVTVEVMIDEEGSVISAKPISGPDHLRSAAVSAARGWKWTPTKVERKRTRVVGTITFDFKD
jgi:TonB family protein